MPNHKAGGRRTIDLESMKDLMLDLHRQGNNYDEIALQVQSTERTVRRQFAEWGIRRRAPKTQREDPGLRA